MVTFESNRIANCHPTGGLGCISAFGGIIHSKGNTYDYLSGAPFSGTNLPVLITEGDSGINWNPTLIFSHQFEFYRIEYRSQLAGNRNLVSVGGVGVTTGVGAVHCVAFRGVLSLCPDTYDGHWTLNEGVDPTYRNILPLVQSSDPGCTYIGRVWEDTTTTTTAHKVCLKVSGTLRWVSK